MAAQPPSAAVARPVVNDAVGQAVAHPLSPHSVPKSRRTSGAVPHQAGGSVRTRPATSYFDLGLSASSSSNGSQDQAAARTPRPSTLVTRNSSSGHPHRSEVARSRSASRGEGELQGLGLRGSASSASRASAAVSPARSPEHSSSVSFNQRKEADSSLLDGGARTPRSHASSRPHLPAQPPTTSLLSGTSGTSPARTQALLTRAEQAALEARYDLLSPAELAEVLARWEAERTLMTVGGSREQGQAGGGALFPDAESGKAEEHPMRLLARAGRKLWQAQIERERGAVVPVPVVEPSDDYELHTDLQEALSTSLAFTTPPAGTSAEARSLSSFSTLASPSPSRTAPSLISNGKQRTGSISTIASSTSVVSARSGVSAPASTRVHAPTSTKGSNSKSWSTRSRGLGRTEDKPATGSWMGMWGWRGSQSKVKGAEGVPPLSDGHPEADHAVSPGVPTTNPTPSTDAPTSPDSILTYPPYPTPSHFRAIFLSTRLLSADASSLFNNAVAVEPLISRLAFELVSDSRARNITVPDQRRLHKPFPRSLSGRPTASSATSALTTPDDVGLEAEASTLRKASSMGIVEQPLLAASSALSRALNSASKARPMSVYPALNLKVSVPSQPAAEARQTDVNLNAPAPSVELESIEPQESRPPTLISDRSGLRRLFSAGRTSPSASLNKSRCASQLDKKLEPLTDKYGFIYDMRNLALLREASDAGAPAPAVFAGLPRTEQDHASEDEEDNWVENNIILSPGRRPGSGSRTPSSIDMQKSTSSASGVSLTFADAPTEMINDVAPTSPTDHGGGRRRSSTILSLNPSPARAVAAPQPVHVSADVTAADVDEKVALKHRQAFGLTGRKTIQLLLSQLSEVHEKQQTSQKAAWDAFLRKRQARRLNVSSPDSFVGFAAMATASAGKVGRDDHREFVKLVRGGVPIVYRAKVWLECSGAHDLMVPGEYAELLEQAEREGIASTTLAEIEKDVVRTLPLNVFFRGDGPGVPKLRRLLTAYAWRNLDLGYCQGLNQIAATLLLTYEREEEAFWVFTCLVERLMPPDYYTPSLLCSRADQRVLQDLVRQELPRLEAHLTELGVEVAAVSFAWFLSLFTDCLPVETLFRLWDLFFVEGFDVFFRCALAILKVNEDALVACDSIGTLYESLEACTSRLWSPDQLFAVELDLQSRISHTTIITRRAVHVAALVEESNP